MSKQTEITAEALEKEIIDKMNEAFPTPDKPDDSVSKMLYGWEASYVESLLMRKYDLERKREEIDQAIKSIDEMLGQHKNLYIHSSIKHTVL